MALKFFLLSSAVLVLLVIENTSGGAIPTDAENAGAETSAYDAEGSGQPASPETARGIAYSPIPHDTDCTYHFYSYRLTWRDADSFCQRRGMKLAAPKSPSQQTELARRFSMQQEFWIGAHDHGHEGRWYFTDHYVGPARFFNWGWGQPDGGLRQNCVQMNYYRDGKWDDAECYLSKSFVCQQCRPPIRGRK